MLLAACGGPASTGTFRPAGGATSSTPATSPASGASTPGADGLEWPPFGAHAHIDMVDYSTADRAERQAVIADGDFLLAYFYADYTGGRDTRWQAYVAPSARSVITESLAEPDVTTESFTGTIRVWRMSALATSGGSVQVSECVDTAAARNTDLSTGAVLPASEQNSADGNYWLEIDILGSHNGLWQVIKIENPIYYPLASECKP